MLDLDIMWLRFLGILGTCLTTPLIIIPPIQLVLDAFVSTSFNAIFFVWLSPLMVWFWWNAFYPMLMMGKLFKPKLWKNKTVKFEFRRKNDA